MYQVIYRLESENWVGVNDCLEFLPNNGESDQDQIKFIIASEETGWRHLYLITAQIFHGEKLPDTECE